jgi:hypothetical protein
MEAMRSKAKTVGVEKTNNEKTIPAIVGKIMADRNFFTGLIING